MAENKISEKEPKKDILSSSINDENPLIKLYISSKCIPWNDSNNSSFPAN
jgi:hypothetical protein